MSAARYAVAILACLLLGACGSAPSPAPAQGPTPGPAVSIPAAATAAVNQAREEAAHHWGIDASQVTVLEATAVDWPNAGLGCPKAGGMFAQVITPGFRIRVSGAGQALEYHSDMGGRVVNCSSP